MKTLRLASSGPVLKNAEGGIAVPGEGFELRMVETKATVGGTFDTTLTELNGAGQLRVGMVGVKPNLRYKAQVQVNTFYEVNTSGGQPVRFRVLVERSLDGGATWQGVMSDFFETRGSNEARMAVANVSMSLGSGVFWDIPETAEEEEMTMVIRAMAQTAEGDQAVLLPTQQGFISLTELM